MKNCILQVEADNHRPIETKANVAKSNFQNQNNRDQKHSEVKCYRCNKFGHYQTDCPLKKLNAWFCYHCNEIRGHKGDECSNPQNMPKENNRNNGLDNRGKGKNSFRGNQGGRTVFRGRVVHNKRFVPYNKEGNQNKQPRNVNAKLAGKNSYVFGNKNYISFIADSGATEHIINKGFLLRDFVKSTGEEIRSANKNKSANIQIDGRGNLYLKPKTNNKICLLNVISASNISDNLLSLRKFAEAGYGIYLDD